MIQFDHKQKFIKIQEKNASLYKYTFYCKNNLFMDICMILIRKKKSLFYHMLEKSNYSKFSLEIKQKFRLKRKKKKHSKIRLIKRSTLLESDRIKFICLQSMFTINQWNYPQTQESGRSICLSRDSNRSLYFHKSFRQIAQIMNDDDMFHHCAWNISLWHVINKKKKR